VIGVSLVVVVVALGAGWLGTLKALFGDGRIGADCNFVETGPMIWLAIIVAARETISADVQ
jgi:hypothetical protein